jgi:hypothetical protein
MVLPDTEKLLLLPNQSQLTLLNTGPELTVRVAALLVTLVAPPVALTITRYWLPLSPDTTPVNPSDDDVAPLIAANVLPLSVDRCH